MDVGRVHLHEDGIWTCSRPACRRVRGTHDDPQQWSIESRGQTTAVGGGLTECTECTESPDVRVEVEPWS
jgi:hypothetical protein